MHLDDIFNLCLFLCSLLFLCADILFWHIIYLAIQVFIIIFDHTCTFNVAIIIIYDPICQLLRQVST